MGLLVYIVLNGVRLAERYVEAKEIEARYFVEKRKVIDKKEMKLYYFEFKNGEAILKSSK